MTYSFLKALSWWQTTEFLYRQSDERKRENFYSQNNFIMSPFCFIVKEKRKGCFNIDLWTLNTVNCYLHFFLCSAYWRKETLLCSKWLHSFISPLPYNYQDLMYPHEITALGAD